MNVTALLFWYTTDMEVEAKGEMPDRAPTPVQFSTEHACYNIKQNPVRLENRPIKNTRTLQWQWYIEVQVKNKKKLYRAFKAKYIHSSSFDIHHTQIHALVLIHLYTRSYTLVLKLVRHIHTQMYTQKEKKT